MEEGVYIWNEDFYLWLNEWMSIDKRLSFFFVCLRERVRVRESRNKSFSECMCAVLSLFPRTEVWRGLIFLAAVRSGWEAETARGSCFLWGSPASSHMAFDPFWLPSPTKLPTPPPKVFIITYMCVRVSVCQQMKVGVAISVVRGAGGGKLWNKQWNLGSKMKWDTALNQVFYSLPLSLF